MIKASVDCGTESIGSTSSSSSSGGGVALAETFQFLIGSVTGSDFSRRSKARSVSLCLDSSFDEYLFRLSLVNSSLASSQVIRLGEADFGKN